ncbi:hypothetical protein [Stieleria tagensis]|nr:hypothetical protein [Stieleria tagensis]
MESDRQQLHLAEPWFLFPLAILAAGMISTLNQGLYLDERRL